MNTFIDEMANEFSTLLDCGLLKDAGKNDSASFNFFSIYDHSFVDSTQLAVFLVKTINWENTLIEMRNDLLASVEPRLARQVALAELNSIAGALRGHLDDSMIAYCNPGNDCCSPGARAFFEHGDTIAARLLKYTFLSYAQELHISKKHSHVSHYFRDLIQAYKQGHLPCSWDGPFPQGILFIF